MPSNIFEQFIFYLQSVLAGIVFGLSAVILFNLIFKRKKLFK
jgi:hypothetical protein